MLRTLFDHQNFSIALNDLGLDLADFFVEKDVVGQLAVKNLLADFGHALRTERICRAGPAKRWLRFLVRLEEGLVRPLRSGGSIRLDAIQSFENRPRSGRCDGDCFFNILYWFMHVLSLSTVGSFVPCQFWVEVFWFLRNVLPSPILTGCNYVYGGATWEPQFLGVLQGDLIVDQRVNHTEGSERENIEVKRGLLGLGGAKLLKLKQAPFGHCFRAKC